jgi:hypothetical protein
MAKGDGTIIERILRDRHSIWIQVAQRRSLGALVGRMVLSSVLSLAVYGAVLGASNGWQQALSSVVKLPLLFFATLAICLPTLYLFNLLFGARLSMLQAVALIMMSITVTGMLTLAFAPISLFFLISAHSYVFFKLLNVAVLFLTAVIGLRFLTAGMAALNAYQAAVAKAERAATPALEIPTPPAPVPVAVPVPAQVGAAGPVDANGTAPALPPAPNTGAPVLAPVPNTGAPVVSVFVDPVLRLVPAPEPVERPASRTLLYVWLALFGFVGTQLGWTLRPFFGSPDEPFQVFRNLDGTFFGDLIKTLAQLLGAS